MDDTDDVYSNSNSTTDTINAADSDAIDVTSGAFDALMASDDYPDTTVRAGQLPLYRLMVPDEHGNPTEPFAARILAFATTFRDDAHSHRPGTVPERGTSCSKCRWSDVVIVQTHDVTIDPDTFVFIGMGKSAIPGESTRLKTVWTAEVLTLLGDMHINMKGGRRALPDVNREAFREAADRHEAFAQVYRDHAAVFERVG